jgi:pimeloyl-ACP methyl ester carboxylesterase
VLGFGAEAIDAQRVRLIGLDRAGLGLSDPAADRTFRDWADDVRDFIDACGLNRPPIVGFSQGAPFALACATAGTVSAVAIVSGTDELAAPHFADLLPLGLRELVQRVTADPDGAAALFATMTAATMHQMVIDGAADADREVFDDAEFDRVYRAALEEGFARGAGSYARDTVLAMSPWPFALDTIAVPVDLWYGALDASPVHSPDFGKSLAERIPTARRKVIDSAGGALLWTHAAEILGQLLKRKPS